ncbi:lysozyme inhibitor LprI family protein [Geitlerinema sp. CS-897]|nr:lysozyme inhibitor LprI family protein [Geitlerinema sp. CS-897]
MSHLPRFAYLALGLALLAAGCQKTATPDRTGHRSPSSAIASAVHSPIAHASTSDRDHSTATNETPAIDCSSPQTTIEINECAARDYHNADDRLNRTYDELMAALNDSNREKLIDAQLTWLKFRDANCQWEAFRYDGGTLQTSIRLNCLERLTQQRIQDLENYRDAAR